MTLRESIMKGLGEKWTRELEDDLFWSVSEFVDRVRQTATITLPDKQNEPQTAPGRSTGHPVT